MARLIVPIVLVLLVGLVLAEAKNTKARQRESRNLLKDESNEIDHGPDYKTNPEAARRASKRKQQLLGSWGENHLAGKRDKKRRRKLQLKAKKRGQGRRDDIRLQDLEHDFDQPQQQRRRKPYNAQKKAERQLQKAKKQQQRKDLKKELKADIYKALSKGMTPEKLMEQLAAEGKYPKKMYTKLVEKYSRKAKTAPQPAPSALNNSVP